jgi:hypothetical protein
MLLRQSVWVCGMHAAPLNSPPTAAAAAAAAAVMCSIWYELAYIESTAGVAKGQRVWQLAFGSGFKFNSAVLQANRRILDRHAAWEVRDCCDYYLRVCFSL